MSRTETPQKKRQNLNTSIPVTPPSSPTTMKTMMTMTKSFLVYMILALSWTGCVAQDVVRLDTITMELRSTADSNSPNIVEDILHVTAKFLKEYFSAYYNGGDEGSQKPFQDVELVEHTFGVEVGEGHFFCTLEFNGELQFQEGQGEGNHDPEVITSLMRNAFRGPNMSLYLQDIIRGDNTFLTDLTNILIEVDNVLLSETTVDSIRPDLKKETSSEKPWDLNDWVEVTIYAVAGFAGAMFLAGIYCLVSCVRGGRGQIQDEYQLTKLHETPDWKPESRTDGGLPPQSRPSKNTNIQRITTSKHPRPSSRGQLPRPPSTKNNSRQELLPTRTQPTPTRSSSMDSPVSTFSHDMSLFTTGDASRDVGTISLGSISNLHLDHHGQNFDLEAWQNPTFISSKVPAPFGHDISAIEKQDQMSMLDNDFSILRPRTSGQQRPLDTKRKPRSDLPPMGTRSKEVRPSSSSSSFRPPYLYSSSAARYATTIPEPETSSRDSSTDVSMSNSSDVINDLKNLSMQIDQHRRSQRSSS